MGRRNPPLATFANPPVLSEEVTRLEYRHAGDGKRYFHDFDPPVIMRAIDAHTIELHHPTAEIVEDIDI